MKRLLLAMLLLSACASTVQRTATKHLREGRFVEASDVWLDALEADQDDPLARKRIAEVAPDAYRLLLDVAREHEAEARLEQSIAAYRELLAFLERLDGVGARSFEAEDVRGELVAAEDALTRRYYEEGIAAFGEGRYVDAVALWGKSRALRPDYEDTTRRMASALHLQATLDLGTKRYRDALARFEASHALDKNPLSAAWAGAIRTGWGRHELRQGNCRAAYDHLRAARDTGLDPQLGDDLERARSCSRVELIVHPFEDLTGDAAKGTALGAVLSDRMAGTLRADGTEHLRLIDPDAAPAEPAPEEGRRFQVRGRVTRYQVDRVDDRTVSQKGLGRTLEPCDAEDGDLYDEVEGWLCEIEVPIAWSHHTRSLAVSLGASMRVIDGRGEQVVTQPIDTEARSEISWVDAFVDEAGAPLRVADKPGVDIVAIPPELLALSGPPGSLTPEGTLVGEAVSELADKASMAVLQAVDTKSESPEPSWLDVKEPGTAPEDIQFRPAAPPRDDVATESAPI